MVLAMERSQPTDLSLGGHTSPHPTISIVGGKQEHPSIMYVIHKTNATLSGEITLAGSKSISNRSLIIRALCGEKFPIALLANAKDTDLLQSLLASTDPIRDAGAAGTTFRFMTAYLATQPGTQTLTGTERMKQRPIGVLVDALRTLGAHIEYLEKEGYPPLLIGPPDNLASTIKYKSPRAPVANTSLPC